MTLPVDKHPLSSTHGEHNRPRTIGLCMIVKNEAQVIARCLESLKPFVDYMLIEDTGSTDGTQTVIREWLAQHQVAGEVIDEPWQNFAFNRSHVMERLRHVTTVDFALIMDADDRLVLEDGFDVSAFKANMRADLYDVQVRHGGALFYRPHICSNKRPFCYKAVLHEYLEVPAGAIARENTAGFHIQTGDGGARNKNPRKYQDDAAALEKALLTETDSFLVSRYTFYLAQSYRDCGESKLALKNYLRRAELGYWIEEVFESVYNAARIMEQLGHSEGDIIATYLRASILVPTRAEALHGAAKFCRLKRRYEEAYQYATRAVAIPVPVGALFVERWIYDYGSLDELSISAYWSGHPREALEAGLKLLEGNALPENQRARVSTNARFALEKLG